MSTPPLLHRDDVKQAQVDLGDLRFTRQVVGKAAGCAQIGCSAYAVPAGARQMPVHQHADEEEIFFVLEGSGLSWQDGEACAIGAGDVIVHRNGGVNHKTGGRTHTLLAADDEHLEVIAFASGSETRLTWLPRTGTMWAGPRWLPLNSVNPFQAEADVGALERPAPGERPRNVVGLADVEATAFTGAELRSMGAEAGAVKAGLNHVTLEPEGQGAAFHCHAMEEELFVILEGGGTLRLGREEHELRAGHVVARPPATSVAHALKAGPEGMTYLAYGTRVPGDSIYYPEQGQLWIRGLDLRLEVG